MNKLIEKAKKSKLRPNNRLGKEEIELALAWARGEVSLEGVGSALNLKTGFHSSIYLFLARALREHLRENA